MGIKSINVQEIGAAGVNPRIIYMETDDTIAVVAAAGYLDTAELNIDFEFRKGDMFLVQVVDAGDNKTAWLSLNYTAGQWKLDNPITA